MQSSDKRIRYVEITDKNILLATGIELEIFPEMCGYLSYRKAFERGEPYFLACLGDDAIGITGLYRDDRLGEKGTVWLGWYGLLPAYRKLGLGKRVLLDTIEEAKRRGFDTFRLYTSAVKCPDACILYGKVMDLGEAYTLEEPEMQRMVYSKSLTDKKVVPWNNRYLYLNENHEEEGAARRIYEARLRSE